jgi:excisionase family DNA binding protein
VLPGIVMQMLLDILSEFSKRSAIGVIPHKAELSTQQAANLLKESRPYLDKLLDEGKIKHTKGGIHRRVLVCELLSYKVGRTIPSFRLMHFEVQAQHLFESYHVDILGFHGGAGILIEECH